MLESRGGIRGAPRRSMQQQPLESLLCAFHNENLLARLSERLEWYLQCLCPWLNHLYTLYMSWSNHPLGSSAGRKQDYPMLSFPLERKWSLAAGRREVLHQHLFEGRSCASPLIRYLISPQRQDALKSTVGNHKKLPATNSIVVMYLMYYT